MTKSDGSITKGFFARYWQAEYRTSLSLAPTFTSAVFDCFFRNPRVKAFFASETLLQQKGRDASLRLLSQQPVTQSGNELLFVAGSLGLEEHIEQFHVRIETPFHSSNRGVVRHSVIEQRSQEYPETIPIYEAGRLIPAQIEGFRFGLQKYATKSLSLSFGAAPVLAANLCFDCSLDTIAILVTDSRLKKKQMLWQDDPVFDTLQYTLQKVCNFDLQADISRVLSL